jgi:DNA invertase Pin-like site-specific DNA recombinase
MAEGKFIAYYRVSTDRQGQSGLGLEAQRAAVETYLNGGNWKLLEAYTEVESGKRIDRPELAKALAACRKRKATLVIAKLDRLARNARFLLSVVEGCGEGGVVFCDLPTIPAGPVGKFLITQLASVAELEAGMIAKRTKDALAAKRARGEPMGWAIPKRTDQKKANALGVRAIVAGADQFAANVLPIVRQIQAAGVTTLDGIAEALNARGIATPRGAKWHSSTVWNLLHRTNREAVAA